MSNASTLWASVTSNYEEEGLITLSNPRSNEATVVDEDYGISAAQEVIDIFPLYAQVDFDDSESSHVTVARYGVIAVLFRRGGTSSTIAEVEWDHVFGDDGLATKLKRTSARARSAPSTNSGVTQSSELSSDGRKARPWSDPAALPSGRSYLPRRTLLD